MILYTKNFNIRKNSPGIELTEKYGLKKYTSNEKNDLSNLRKKFLGEVGIKLVKGNARTWKVRNVKSKSPKSSTVKSSRKKQIGPKRKKNDTVKLIRRPRLRKQASGTRKLH
tara:strand:- start:553 stop:888 length:336 start_codon:yes stop_codon:yes gene_type:complete